MPLFSYAGFDIEATLSPRRCRRHAEEHWPRFSLPPREPISPAAAEPPPSELTDAVSSR